MSFLTSRVNDIGDALTMGGSGEGTGFGTALVAAALAAACAGVDDMSRVEAVGLGTGDIGPWWWRGFHIANGGLYVDGSEGVMATDFNANNFSLAPRNWQVPWQFGMDMKLAFPGGSALSDDLFELSFDTDSNGATYTCGCTISAVNGDPSGAARTNFSAWFQHNGFSFAYYFPVGPIVLAAGLWNGPTARLEFRVEQHHVYAKLYDKAGADPGWQLDIDLTGVTGPDGEFDLRPIFSGVKEGPFLRWNGPIYAPVGGGTATTSHSPLLFDNVTVAGCTDLPTPSCRDDFDRLTSGQLVGLWGESPIRNLMWTPSEWSDGIYADGDDGVVYAENGVTPSNNTMGIDYGPTYELFPPYDDYRQHGNLTGPRATEPFEVYIEFTPLMVADPGNPGFNYLWGIGLIVTGGSAPGATTARLLFDNFSVSNGYAGPGDVMEAWTSTTNGGGFPTADPAGSNGDRVKAVMRIEANQTLAKVWVGGSEPGGWDIVEALSSPFDFSDLEQIFVEFDWTDPVARSLMLRLHTVEVRSGLGATCALVVA